MAVNSSDFHYQIALKIIESYGWSKIFLCWTGYQCCSFTITDLGWSFQRHFWIDTSWLLQIIQLWLSLCDCGVTDSDQTPGFLIVAEDEVTEKCLSLMGGKLLPSLSYFKKIFACISHVSSHSDPLQSGFHKYNLRKEILALANAAGNYRSIHLSYASVWYSSGCTHYSFDYSGHCSKSLGAQDTFLQMARTSKFSLNWGTIIYCLCQWHWQLHGSSAMVLRAVVLSQLEFNLQVMSRLDGHQEPVKTHLIWRCKSMGEFPCFVSCS